MNRLGVALFALVVPLVASLLGCDCDDLVITEEFEDFCDGSPCNWESTGPVSRVSTYHPDVHGVAVPAGTTLTALETFGRRRVRVLARCEEGAILRVNTTRLDAPSDFYDWLTSSVSDITTIDVSGDGGCVIDDVGFVDPCDEI